MPSEIPKFKSFSITIRPKNGVDHQIESAFMNFFKGQIKKGNYAIIVAEKEDHERHLHIQLWCTDPKAVGDVRGQMKRIQEKSDPNWDTASHNVLKNGISHAYNDDFYKNYLIDNPDKENDKSEILLKNIPKDTSIYYPTQEYQDQAIQIKNASCKRHEKLSIEFNEWKLINKQTITKYAVAQFLSYKMYGAKTMMPLTSAKAKKELCYSLYLYLRGPCEEATMSFIDPELYQFSDYTAEQKHKTQQKEEEKLKNAHNPNLNIWQTKPM